MLALNDNNPFIKLTEELGGLDTTLRYLQENLETLRMLIQEYNRL